MMRFLYFRTANGRFNFNKRGFVTDSVNFEFGIQKLRSVLRVWRRMELSHTLGHNEWGKSKAVVIERCMDKVRRLDCTYGMCHYVILQNHVTVLTNLESSYRTDPCQYLDCYHRLVGWFSATMGLYTMRISCATQLFWPFYMNTAQHLITRGMAALLSFLVGEIVLKSERRKGRKRFRFNSLIIVVRNTRFIREMVQ